MVPTSFDSAASAAQLALKSPHRCCAWMVKGSEISGFGGGWLEQPRQWLGAQWAGLFLGVPSCPEPPGAP